MISVTALSAGARASYYTGSAAAQTAGPEHYYVNGGPGVWVGAGAAALGLGGRVEERPLAALLAGRSPADDRPLVQAGNGHRKRQAGWDVTLSDPKSLSAVWAVADPDLRKAINDLRREAIANAVVPYLESLCATRRGKGGHVHEPVKIAVAAFFEGYSRENQPQTHTHLVVPNVGVRADGTTGTVLSKPLYAHQGAINALYMCEFARLLEERLGLRCDRAGQWFEARGVSGELCRMWSARKAQIDRAVLDRGVSSAAAREVAALATRKAKSLLVGEGELLRRWRDEARPYALTPDAVRGMLGRVKHADPVAEVKRVIETALARLDETHSHFGHRDLLRAAWTEAIGRGLSAGRVREAVDDALARSPEVTRLGRHRGEERFATAAMLKLEGRLLAAVDELVGTDRHTLRPAVVGAVLGRHATLTDEQRAAVRAVTLADSGVAVLTGLPGTGKTHALSAVRECFEAAGYQLVGAALAGKAARGLESGSGIKSRTVASLLRGLEATPADLAAHHARQLVRAALKKPTHTYQPPRLSEKTVLVLDESGMMDTKTLFRVIEHAKRAGAKVLMVGDPDQLQPIGPGGPLRAVAARVGDAAASLTVITRQREEWARDAILDIRRGEGTKALAAYAVRGRLDVAADRAAAIRSLVESWKGEGVANPKDNLIIASHNADVDRLNRLAQAARRAAGELGGVRPSVGKRHLYLGTPHVTLDSGDRLYAGDRVVVTRTTGPGIVVLPKPIARVFTPGKPTTGINNGDLGTVLKIDPVRKTLTVRFDDRAKPVTISTRYHRDLALGYAVTTHRAQGVTTENAFVLLGGGMQDRETTFVQASRARGATRLFTDRLEAGPKLENLCKQVEKSRAKDLAHDIIDQARPPVLAQQIHA